MQFFSLLSFGLFGSIIASPLVARHASKTKVAARSMRNIRDEINLMTIHIRAVECDCPESVMKVARAAEHVQNAINESRKEISCLKKIGIIGALKMKFEGKKIKKAVNRAMVELIAKKPVMCSLGVVPMVYKSLQDQVSCSRSLGETIIEKLPKVMGKIARKKMNKPNKMVQEALRVYQQPCGGNCSCQGNGKEKSCNCHAEKSCKLAFNVGPDTSLKAFISQFHDNSGDSTETEVVTPTSASPLLKRHLSTRFAYATALA